MNEQIEQLRLEYLAARELASALHDRLREAAIAAHPVKVGDLVRVCSKVGRVTKMRFEISHWRAGDPISISPIVYPVKKDGTTSQVGRLYVGDKVEVIEAAK